jgi:hypothetical protein
MDDQTGESPANIIGGIVGGATGAALGLLLAKQLGLTGWKKWALVSAATVGGAALGAFLGPYVAKLAKIAGSAIKSGASSFKATIKAAGTAIKQSRQVTSLINNASKLKRTATVMKNVASRPYIESTQTIQNIMKAAKPIADSSLKNGLKWVVDGTFNGTAGKYELVIDVATNTIVHFLFKGNK